MSIKWTCRKMSRGEVNHDPVQEQFFISREDATEALVREATQNSLDAVRGKQVTIRFSFPDAKLTSSEAEEWLAGLAPHVKQVLGPMPSAAMSFLVIEDFGTRGLRGDPRQEEDVPVPLGGARNDFYYFWRNVGRSSKSETDLGRWGLGKTVFPAASTINSFFGLTVRDDDQRSLLMGQSVLKTHAIDGVRHCPYVYFGQTGTDDFTDAVDEPSVIERFRAVFKLKRTTEPGFSVVVPFPQVDEVEAPRVTRAAIRNYFHPILAERLVVEVDNKGTLTTISASSIEAVANACDWRNADVTKEQLLRLFELDRWALTLPAKDLIELQPPPPKKAPVWSDALFSKVQLPSIQKRFEAGEQLAFKVNVRVCRKGREEQMTSFNVFLKRDDSLKSGEDHYIRRGITITGIHQLRGVPVRALLIVDDPALSALLGDSEEPAHTDWQERATRLKETYDYGPFTVRFVRTALKQIVEQVTRPPAGLNEKLLQDIFFITQPTVGPDPEPPPPPPFPSLPPTSAPVRVEKIDGGFRVSGRPGLTGRVLVDIAYEVRRGNAFKKYDVRDFDLSKDLEISASAANASGSGNRLTIDIESDGFEARVTGFDPNRDLKLKSMHQEAEAE